MAIKLDNYTKFILTVIAIALLLNAAVGFLNISSRPSVVHAGSDGEMKITDVRSTWPIKIEITNWPSEYRVKNN